MYKTRIHKICKITSFPHCFLWFRLITNIKNIENHCGFAEFFHGLVSSQIYKICKHTEGPHCFFLGCVWGGGGVVSAQLYKIYNLCKITAVPQCLFMVWGHDKYQSMRHHCGSAVFSMVLGHHK